MKFNNLDIIKSTLILLCFFMAVSITSAQVRVDAENNVGIGTNTPDPKAKLEIESSSGGFLKPRMNTAQRLAMSANPSIMPVGLEVYDLELNRTFWWNGSVWVTNTGGVSQTISTNGDPGNIMLSNGGNTLNLNVNDADHFIGNEVLGVTTNGLIRTGDGIVVPFLIGLPMSNQPGTVLKWNGAKWVPSPDDGITNVTSNGLVRTGAGNPTSPYLVGLPHGGVTGNVLKWNGTLNKWEANSDNVGITAELDGVIGNEITNVTGNGLTKSGTGTAASPYSVSNTSVLYVEDETPAVPNSATIRTLSSGAKGVKITSASTSGINITEVLNPSGHDEVKIKIENSGATPGQVLKSDANGVYWADDNVNDADSDPNNENQTLSINGNFLSITNGNQIPLPAAEVSNVTASTPLLVTNNPTNTSIKNVSITSGALGQVLKTKKDPNNSANQIVDWSNPLEAIPPLNVELINNTDNFKVEIVPYQYFGGGPTQILVTDPIEHDVRWMSSDLIYDQQFWKLGGNTIPTSETNGPKLGTKSAHDLPIVTGDQLRIKIDLNGRMRQYFPSPAESNVCLGFSNFNGNNSLTGQLNVLIGDGGKYTSSGAENVYIGQGTANQNTTGSRNIAIGKSAFYLGTADGNDNIFIGTSAHSSSTNGLNNMIAIGNGATVSATNSIAIGNGTIASAMNSIALGNYNIVFASNGSVNWTANSDRRIKQNITESVPGISFVKALRPVQYFMNMEQYAKLEHVPDSLRDFKSEEAKGKIKYTGFIAQEVEAAAKQVDFDFSGVDKPKSEDGIYGLRYAEFVVPLVKAVQEQQTMIEDLQANKVSQSNEIEKLKAENETIKNLLNELSARLTKLENK